MSVLGIDPVAAPSSEPVALLLQPRRLSFGGFGTLRRKRPDDGEDYVCPMNVEMPKSSSFQRGTAVYEEELDHLDQVWVDPDSGDSGFCLYGLFDPVCHLLLQMEDSEGTVRQIGAFSEEINNLTVRSPASTGTGS